MTIQNVKMNENPKDILLLNNFEFYIVILNFDF